MVDRADNSKVNARKRFGIEVEYILIMSLLHKAIINERFNIL
jgi:hypothetical protein